MSTPPTVRALERPHNVRRNVAPCNLMSLFNAAARNDLPPITLIAVHDFADTDGVTRYDIFIEASNPSTGGVHEAGDEAFEGAVRQ